MSDDAEKYAGYWWSAGSGVGGTAISGWLFTDPYRCFRKSIFGYYESVPPDSFAPNRFCENRLGLPVLSSSSGLVVLAPFVIGAILATLAYLIATAVARSGTEGAGQENDTG